jgi:hypothetical protein
MSQDVGMEHVLSVSSLDSSDEVRGVQVCVFERCLEELVHIVRRISGRFGVMILHMSFSVEGV